VLKSGLATRRDRIYVSAEMTPLDAAYVFDQVQRAGSDHALHWVMLDGPS